MPLVGCRTTPLRPVNADGTCGHRIGKRHRPKLTCTPTAVPSEAVDADAKRFEADPASLTGQVLRRRWADARMMVPMTVDGAASTDTVPEFLARRRLKPGAGRLSAQWEGQAVDKRDQGRAGDLRVGEPIGSG